MSPAVKAAPDKVITYTLPDSEMESQGEVEIQYWDKGHKYTVNGDDDFASVTKILGMFDKPELLSWAQNVGVLGALKLHHKGEDLAALLGSDPEITVDDWKDEGFRECAFEILKRHGLRTWDLTDRAKDRGNDVHAALERYAKDAAVPVLSDFDPEVRPYIRGLASFLTDSDLAVASSEVMVASLKHRFVGTYDLRAMTRDCELVTNAETGSRTRVDLGMYGIDLKTGKRIYDEASGQLAGYELASIECGHKPTDGRFVVRVTAQGTYEIAVSWTEPETFGIYADAWHAREADKKAKAALAKNAAKAAEGIAA